MYLLITAEKKYAIHLFHITSRHVGTNWKAGLKTANLIKPLKRKTPYKPLLSLYTMGEHGNIQPNLNSSNTDGSFTMANSNSFLSPYEILPLTQENKYLGKFSYFIMKLYVVCTH